MFEPRPLPHTSLPPQQGKDATSDWYSQQHREPSSYSLQLEGFLPGRSRMSAFLILLPVTCHWGCVPGECCHRWLLPSPYSGNAGSATENAGARSPLLGFTRWWFHIRRGKLRTPWVLLPLYLALRNETEGVSQREVCHCPHPQIQSPGSNILPGTELGHKMDSS